jgi:hypothetical protein
MTSLGEVKREAPVRAEPHPTTRVALAPQGQPHKFWFGCFTSSAQERRIFASGISCPTMAMVAYIVIDSNN